MKMLRLTQFALRCLMAAILCQTFTGCAGKEKTIVWNLSPEARQTYAILLLDQSIRESSPAGVIEAAETFLDADPAPRQPLIEAASWLLYSKDPAAARILLQKGTEKMPDDLALQLLLAETWVDENQPEKAVDLLKKFTARRPDSDEGKQELAILLSKINRHEEADAAFRALPSKLCTPYVRLCHARSLIGIGKNDDAVKQLTLALADQPDSDEIREALAEALELTGNKAKSRILYQHLLNKNPKDISLRLRLMRLELGAGRPQAALALARAGSEDKPFCLSAASLFLDTEHPAEAETFLGELTAQPGAPDEYRIFLAAAVFERSADSSRALSLLADIPEQSAAADQALYVKAQILLTQQRWQEAAALLEEGIARYPGNPEFPVMLAQAYTNLKNGAAACKVLDRAAEQSPNNTELLFIQATARDLNGDSNGAFAVMERIITLNPNHYRALNYIGYKLADTPSSASPQARKADLDRALTLLQKAVSLAPDKAYILDSLAWAQFRSGQLERAWENIRKTVTLEGGAEEAEIWEHYGDIAASLGNEAEARRGWEKALSLNPENTGLLREKLQKFPKR